MLNRTKVAVRNYLELHTEEALDLAIQMNSWNGSFDWTETYRWEELCAYAAEGGADAVDNLVKAAVYGEVYGGTVRYNGCGNLESGEEEVLLEDAEDYLSDIMYGLNDFIDDSGYACHINVSYNLQEVIDESIMMESKVRISNIVYDITEEDEMTQEDIDALPKELIFTLIGDSDIDSDDEASFEWRGIDPDTLADMISDETGWCVTYFECAVVKEKEEDL